MAGPRLAISGRMLDLCQNLHDMNTSASRARLMSSWLPVDS